MAPPRLYASARVDGNTAIFIDFTPLGGPDNYKGIYRSGNIFFPGDKGEWKRLLTQ